MDLGERRASERQLHDARVAARREYVAQAQVAATADAEYRKVKAQVFTTLRAEGQPVEAAKIQADAASADERHRRDVAQSLAKAALLKIEECERASVTIRDIHASSERVDGLAA
jgi:hypothetical protein